MATTIDAMVAAGKAAGIEISATQAAFAAGFSQARNGLSGKKIKLLYFGVRGAGEVARYLLAISGTPFEDFRYPITFGTPGDFSTMSRVEFDEAKAAGTFKAGMGRIPILEVDGVQIAQSKAIERFIAQSTGMMGADAVQAAQIDAQLENLRDVKDQYQKAKRGEDKEAAMKKWFGEDLPAWAAKWDATVSDFMTSGAVSIADVSIYYFFTFYFDNVEGAQAALKGNAKLEAMCAKVKANAEAMAWEKKRPVTFL